MGVDGTGIKVAVLDSGIDYTHANFGGGGTLDDYMAAYGADPSDPANTTNDGLFPTAKVVDGYDFVGEAWPNGELAFDEDPIDFEGHGTHVADIIGGVNGVAPGADLIGIKVCSAVSSSCNGVAILLGIEYAVNAGADIINMSLGSDYGSEYDDDTAAAVEAASALGVLTVAAAGNGGNNAYVTGTPAAAETALSVAQTAVPSAFLDFMVVEGGGSYPAIFQSWAAPLEGAITAPAQYGDTDGTNLDGCLPYTGDLSGKIVLADRGGCFFSDKILNIGQAGGLVGVIGLVAPGEPFTGGFGGGDLPTIPGFMVSLAAADDFRAAAAAGLTITFDPANGASLVGTMTSSSSRGPSNFYNQVKPEIGAPGASLSAEVGTGSGETPFGGTSGASPMVAGSAALLLDHFDDTGRHMRPRDIKALLMSSAETEIYTTATAISEQLAPITRIGGGEVRVDRAMAATGYVYDRDRHGSGSAALSIGQVDLIRVKTYTKRMAVVNITGETRTYDLSVEFRDPAKAATEAVDISLPESVTVPAYSEKVIEVEFEIDPRLLPPWALNVGGNGAGADALDLSEYDGYILLDDRSTSDDDADPMHAAWHLLPRAAAQTRLTGRVPQDGLKLDSELFGFPAAEVGVANWGYGTADVTAFSLLARE